MERRRQIAFTVTRGAPDGFAAESFSRVPLSFDDYSEAVRNHNQWQRAIRREDDDGPRAYLPGNEAAIRVFVANFRRGRHTPDLPGWLTYLADLGLNVGGAMEQPVELPEQTRQMHTLVAGRIGSGKSELLKALIHHHVAVSPSAVVVLDPHGDMARDVAQWPLFQGEARARLVYLEYDAAAGRWPVINPLDVPHLNAHQRGDYGRQIAAILADALPEKAEFTPNMVTLIDFGCRVLFEHPGATLTDLRRLMSVPNPALLATARAHPNPEVADFFAGDFGQEIVKSAKQGLTYRLRHLLAMDAFRALTCGPSTVRLPELLDAGHVILVNLDSLGPAAGDAFGKLLVAQIFAHAMRRGPNQTARPVHLFMDEAERMFTGTFIRMLQEARKRGLHVTFAQQTAGRGFEGTDKDSLFLNTAIKLQGAGDCPGRMRQALGLDPETLSGLFADAPFGVFACKWGNQETIKLTVRGDLAHDRMPPEAFAALMAEQRKRYTTTLPSPAPGDPPAEPPRKRRRLEP